MLEYVESSLSSSVRSGPRIERGTTLPTALIRATTQPLTSAWQVPSQPPPPSMPQPGASPSEPSNSTGVPPRLRVMLAPAGRAQPTTYLRTFWEIASDVSADMRSELY